MEAIQSKTQAQGATDQSMRDLQPGRSFAPPKTNLKASSAFLKGSVGRGGENQPEDLRQLATFLYRNGAPRQLLRQIIDPAQSGDLIARYQREVLGFGKGDGRIDPGGKTIAAILDQRGKDVVAGWYGKKEEAGKKKPSGVEKGKKGEGLKKPNEKGHWLVPPVLSQADYITQAPPRLAHHKQTLSHDKMFRFALAKYGPGGNMDIAKEKKVKSSWKKLSYAQRLEKVHWIACMNTCVAMMEKVGASPDFSKKVTTITEDLKAKSIAANGNLDAGVSVIEKNLSGGHPVVMGVHKDFRGMNSDATDHFVIAVGLWQEGGRTGIAYFDPGTGRAAGWDVSQNIIWVDSDSGLAVDEKNYGSATYTLSRVTDNI